MSDDLSPADGPDDPRAEPPDKAGTHRGRPVVVLVLPASGDRDTAVLLDQETCRAVSVVNLL